MKVLDKADFAKINNRKIEQVEMSEWGGAVRLRELSANERDEFEFFVNRSEDQPFAHIRHFILVRSIINADGTHVFDFDDPTCLDHMSTEDLSMLFHRAMVLNGLKENSFEDAAGN